MVVIEKLRDNENEEGKRFAVSAIHIHCTELHILIDTRAIPNLRSARLVKRLSSKPADTCKVVTVDSTLKWLPKITVVLLAQKADVLALDCA